jgi:rubrerythrin
MKEVRAAAKAVGIKIPVGTKKVDAIKLVEAKRAETPDAVNTLPTAEPESERPAGRTLEIVKVNDRGDWWCPHCDHSMNSKERHCPNCLAERDGEKAVRP